MMRMSLFYLRNVLCSFVLAGFFIYSPAVSAQGNEPITWVTSKAAAVTKALNEGKYILLLAGASYCQHCYNMHYVVCEENNPQIKAVIEENYVPWYCDVSYSDEYEPYSTEPYIPLTCRIDPRDPENYIDQYYGSYLNNEEVFYNRLLNGLGDIDSDGMPDEWERLNGLDALHDDAADDLDNDGLSNIDEYTAGTNPNNKDSDGDIMQDGWEVQYGFNPLVNDAANDPDNDGLKNIDEYNAGTNPKNPDTDGDTMPDKWEVQYGLNPLVNDADNDLDGDGFSNIKEYLKGTIPNDAGSHPKRAMPWLPLLLEEN